MNAWIAGARPRTLPAAVVPVLVGTAAAAGMNGGVDVLKGLIIWRFIAALVVSLALQIGVNFANDYSDGIRGTDDERVGPMRLTGSGSFSLRLDWKAGIAAIGPGRVGLRRRAEAPSVPVTCLPRFQSSPLMERPEDWPAPVTREV